MVNLKIKPLSVNDVWRGRRFKTNKYKSYEKEMFLIMPKLKLPPPPYDIYYEFGFSSKGSDIDNPIKPLQDILQKHYKFNDSQIYRIEVVKKIVKKGNEYINFDIRTLNKQGSC